MECGPPPAGGTCTGPRVDSCHIIQMRNLVPQQGNGMKILTLTTSDYTLLETLVPFCGEVIRSRSTKKELALLPNKLKLL